MYPWLLYLHIAAVIAFMLGHGVQVAVMLRQRSEGDPERNLALFEMLPTVKPLRYMSLGIVVTGLLLVAVLSLWARWWIWTSLGLLVGIWLVMYRFGGAYYTGLEDAATRAIESRGQTDEADAMAAFTRARRGPHPLILAAVGLGGVAVILWLMVFKPF